MNRLAGIVAATALAGGVDKWYQDSARLLSYNVLKSGATGQREETIYLYRGEYEKHLAAEGVKLICDHVPTGAAHPFALDEVKVFTSARLRRTDGIGCRRRIASHGSHGRRRSVTGSSVW